MTNKIKITKLADGYKADVLCYIPYTSINGVDWVCETGLKPSPLTQFRAAFHAYLLAQGEAEQPKPTPATRASGGGGCISEKEGSSFCLWVVMESTVWCAMMGMFGGIGDRSALSPMAPSLESPPTPPTSSTSRERRHWQRREGCDGTRTNNPTHQRLHQTRPDHRGRGWAEGAGVWYDTELAIIRETASPGLVWIDNPEAVLCVLVCWAMDAECWFSDHLKWDSDVFVDCYNGDWYFHNRDAKKILAATKEHAHLAMLQAICECVKGEE